MKAKTWLTKVLCHLNLLDPSAFPSAVTSKSIVHTYSKEILYHFNCGNCTDWWSIGDFNPNQKTQLYCPSCGYLFGVKENVFGLKPP